jgi:hypothetical protein
MTMRLVVATALALLFCETPFGAEGAKVKRVKAGKKYNVHDAVHIVVNKVGCVMDLSTLWRLSYVV